MIEIEYDLILSGEYSAFVGAVRDFISKGFEPLGGVSYSVDPDGTQSYAQAMIRREQPNAYYNRIAALKDGSAEIGK